ncbi:MAG: PIN domain-containing protein [Candidatus Symbiobacter sp.]|nr:PIN domain-containing protein [Candidatus Symbiobacter sp.]
MRYVLDTNILAYVARGSEKIAGWAEESEANEMFIAAITLAELLHGINRMSDRSFKRKNEIIVESFQDSVLPFTIDSAIVAGKLLAQTPNGTIRKNSFDILIAATSIAHDCCLVTNNDKDFALYPELRWINPIKGSKSWHFDAY